MTRRVFALVLTAGAEHIDELGHVNNAVWVRWIQDVAVAHWNSVAQSVHKQAYYWVVVRHEIDYLYPAREGDQLMARTFVGEKPNGARFDRFTEFIGKDGRICVRAKSVWAIIDRSSNRPVRVPPEVIAPFISPE